MNQNDIRKLYYEAKNNKAMVAAINEMFETCINNELADSPESANADLKELVDYVYENIN